jgi:hypothetical protein
VPEATADKLASDYSGWSVSSAGDVNGDGLDDLIVNAWSADPDNKLSAGKSYVVFGKQNNTDAINLSLITKPSVLVPATMADKLMTSVLSCLPNTTYDLPADNLPLGSALLAPTIKSTTPMPLTYQPLPLAQVALLSMASQ